MEFMLKGNKRPDIIHCHDWQTGLVPVLLYEIYARLGMDRQRVVYTIHNFKHQGITGEAVLWATGLCRPEYYFHHDRLLDNFNHTAINLMKGGIVYSNYVNTVSPHHSWEARFTDQGNGLGQTLAIHHYKFGGILNGVDYDVWNPEIDRFIPVPLPRLEHRREIRRTRTRCATGCGCARNSSRSSPTSAASTRRRAST